MQVITSSVSLCSDTSILFISALVNSGIEFASLYTLSGMPEIRLSATA